MAEAAGRYGGIAASGGGSDHCSATAAIGHTQVPVHAPAVLLARRLLGEGGPGHPWAQRVILSEGSGGSVSGSGGKDRNMSSAVAKAMEITAR